MDFAHSLKVSLPDKRLQGLPDDWVLVSLLRLRQHFFCRYCAIIAPKKSLPHKGASANLPDAQVILFVDESRVMETSAVSHCRLNAENGGALAFSVEKVDITFGLRGGSFQGLDIPAADVLLSL